MRQINSVVLAMRSHHEENMKGHKGKQIITHIKSKPHYEGVSNGLINSSVIRYTDIFIAEHVEDATIVQCAGENMYLRTFSTDNTLKCCVRKVRFNESANLYSTFTRPAHIISVQLSLQKKLHLNLCAKNNIFQAALGIYFFKYWAHNNI